MLTKFFTKSKPSRLIDSVRIAAPCEVPFSTMSGDDRIRHCTLCRKNVYNISALSEDDAEKLLRSNTDGLCISLYKRPDGTVMFDNCPVGLRKVRTRTIKIAVILLIAIGLSSLAQRIEAQGLVGAPAEVGGFGRRDLCEPIPSTATVSIGSFVSFVLAVIAGFAKLLGSLNASSIQPGISATEKSIKLIKLRSVVETIILAVAAPAVFYLGCLAVRMYQQNNQ